MPLTGETGHQAHEQDWCHTFEQALEVRLAKDWNVVVFQIDETPVSPEVTWMDLSWFVRLSLATALFFRW